MKDVTGIAGLFDDGDAWNRRGHSNHLMRIPTKGRQKRRLGRYGLHNLAALARAIGTHRLERRAESSYKNEVS